MARYFQGYLYFTAFKNAGLVGGVKVSTNIECVYNVVLKFNCFCMKKILGAFFLL